MGHTRFLGLIIPFVVISLSAAQAAPHTTLYRDPPSHLKWDQALPVNWATLANREVPVSEMPKWLREMVRFPLHVWQRDACWWVVQTKTTTSMGRTITCLGYFSGKDQSEVLDRTFDAEGTLISEQFYLKNGRYLGGWYYASGHQPLWLGYEGDR